MPRPGIDRLLEAYSISQELIHDYPDDNRHKALVSHINSIVLQPENLPELPEWSAAERIVWRYAQLELDQKLALLTHPAISDQATACAVVNGSRWVVNCPFLCSSAQMASWQDRRFFCCDCLNRSVDGQWIGVVWPDNHLDIEQWLLARPYDKRHWITGETRDDIMRQDIQATVN